MERGDIKRLMVFMPPRHGKSELCSVQFPPWFLGRNPKKEVIACSYSADLSLDWGRKAKGIVGSNLYTNVFPESALSAASRAADRWQLQQGGGYVCTGVGGAIVGRGAHLLVTDDPLKGRKEADSQLQRDMCWSWYRGNAYTRLAPRGVIILIMTRWHDDDLAGRILNSSGGSYWHVLDLPAIALKDEIVQGKYVRKKGRALWPTRYNEEALHSIKNVLGPYEWACQYQQNPVDEESIEFRKEWVKHRSEEEVDKLMVRRFLTVDTAGKMTRESNHIGIVDNRVDKEGKWNIMARKYKMDPADFVDYLFVLQHKHNYEKIGIEKTIFMDGLEPYIEKVQMEKGIILPIELVKHKGMSKDLRIRGLLPYYKNGMIYHVQGHCDELEPQLFRFPKGAEDDILDALAYQTQIVETPQGWSDDDFGGKLDAYGDPKEVASDVEDPFNPLGEI